jgi:hypothetical protein
VSSGSGISSDFGSDISDAVRKGCAGVQEERLTELFRRELAVDPFQHPRVGVAHRGRDDLVGEGGDAHPRANLSHQINSN